MFDIPSLDTLFFAAVLQIIWIDILLSGDNAVVVAMACRSLPGRQRTIGILLGVAGAVLIRIIFAAIISFLLAIPFLKLVGGILLLYIATGLIIGDDDGAEEKPGSATLWAAVALVVAADVTMSLDNVVAIAAAARGHDILFIFGLLLSMPLMIMGAAAISGLMARWPVLIVAGGGLLGWIAGEMAVTDPFVAGKLAAAGCNPWMTKWAAGAICGAGVIAAGVYRRRQLAAQAEG